MFAFVKSLLPSLPAKMWFALLLIVVTVVAVAYTWYSVTAMNKQLTETQVSLTKTVQDLDQASRDLKQIEKELKLLVESRKIDDDVIDKVDNTKIVYRDRFDLVDKRVEEKVASIGKKYAEMAQNEINEELRDQEISAARIDGAWQTYCASQPNALTCTPTDAKQ